MNEHLRDILLNFSQWELYGTVEPFKIEGTPIPGLKQYCYQTEINGEVISAGVFEYNGKRTHVAWGVKSDPHCSFHALAETGGNWSVVKKDCPEYELLKDGDTVFGFMVNKTGFT
jgi:hypothetical protein